MLSTEVYDRRINQITNIAFPDRRISALLDYTQSHGLRCKQVDGEWHFYKGNNPYNDYIQAYNQPAYSLLSQRQLKRRRKVEATRFNPGDRVVQILSGKPARVVAVRGQGKTATYDIHYDHLDKTYTRFTDSELEKETTMETKFKVGDRAQVVSNKEWRGVVVEVKTAYTIKFEGSVKKSSDAWFDEEIEPARVKLTVEEAWAEVGAMIMDSLHSDPFLEPTLLRHRAYAILGGSDIEVGRQGTELHERVKARLNSLIDRFVKKYLTESKPFGGG